MRKRIAYKHKLILPIKAVSPTDSIYKTFDIVKQGRVLTHTTGTRVFYSMEPFTLSVMVDGKVKLLHSKEIKP